MPEAAHLLARLDRLISQTGEIGAELRELRDAVAASEPPVDGRFQHGDNITIINADDLLDTTSASSRFGYPQDTIRKWCRTEGLGVMQGGRWMVSTERLRKRINGK